ncbi:conserved hypothetical protein [Streptomyces sp. e14]|nr:conserved hypothetical protein [Streptomyces sp. e14]
MERSAAWCHWRCLEIRHGVIRAQLTLRSAGDGRRTTPFSGAGVLRPMWDIGRLSPTGARAVSIAALRVENTPVPEPGGQATVRLLPLTPSDWTHVRPGRRITMHEDRTVAGDRGGFWRGGRPATVPGGMTSPGTHGKPDRGRPAARPRPATGSRSAGSAPTGSRGAARRRPPHSWRPTGARR